MLFRKYSVTTMDLTVIPMDFMDTVLMDLVSLDTLPVPLSPTEVSKVLGERGQPNPGISVMEELMVTTMDHMVIPMDPSDTVLMDLVSPDTLLVPLPPTEVSKVLASKSAQFLNCCLDD